jgi:hypothetical protein
MQSLFDFIIKPKNERYDNKKYIDGWNKCLKEVKEIYR